MSESKLASLVSVDSSSIEIVPDFDAKEIWSQWGGWLHIDDEDLYYERGYFTYSQLMSPQSIDTPIFSSLPWLSIWNHPWRLTAWIPSRLQVRALPRFLAACIHLPEQP
jgi:hypothetical protein